MIFNDKIRVGIVRETKKPLNRKLPLTPPKTLTSRERFPYVLLYVQPNDFLCFKDNEYRYLEQELKEDLIDCNVLLGIKEVDDTTFIPKKIICSVLMLEKNNPITAKCLGRL